MIKQLGNTLLLWACILIGISKSNAQDVDGKTSFILTGVSTDIPKNHKLALYGAYSPTDNTTAFVVWPTLKVNKYLSFTPGYTFLDTKTDNGSHLIENQILASGTVTIPLWDKWAITDRNMYFHRFRKDAGDLSFYRNRLGVTHRFQVAKKQASASLYNEFFLNLDNGSLSRNRIIVSGDIKLTKWLTTQVMYMYQTDKVLGNRQLAFLIITVPLENYGLFNKKNK
ncbi:DUF2490 domain-containing protein [Pedobacter insulae]|uniref:DUF2490 domain-containing protein n=1 Tax=Pedobacter insulae TaxID=414048 RepID=A0A1I2WYX1_9SPHI|nr:DUF2490 domain-containing protein [Pedobacter insulae]SFH06382.1 Protein of unknown function [Pedobacter insulae]